MKKVKLPPTISLEYLINEVRKQEQKEELKKKIISINERFHGSI